MRLGVEDWLQSVFSELDCGINSAVVLLIIYLLECANSHQAAVHLTPSPARAAELHSASSATDLSRLANHPHQETQHSVVTARTTSIDTRMIDTPSS